VHFASLHTWQKLVVTNLQRTKVHFDAHVLLVQNFGKSVTNKTKEQPIC
jgi:hypothetical protein